MSVTRQENPNDLGATLPTGRPTKFTAERKRAYLEELRVHGLKQRAAESVGMSRAHIRRYCRERTSTGEVNPLYDPEFAQEVEDAMEAFAETLKMEAITRARDGWIERKVFDKDGNFLGDVRKYSDQLMLAYLRRVDPGFNERLQVDARAQVQADVSVGLDLESLVPLLSEAGREALRVVAAEVAELQRTGQLERDVTPQPEALSAGEES